MTKKIITWKQADAALIETAVSLIENMERICRTRKDYSGWFIPGVLSPGQQYDESSFMQTVTGLDPFSSQRIRQYFSNISGFIDSEDDRRGLESLPIYSSSCSWAFTVVVIQSLREARGELERLCYRQNKPKTKGPVFSRNQG